MKIARAAALTAALATSACGGSDSPPHGGQAAPGADRSGETAALETGANLLQAAAPVQEIGMYLDGFHLAKENPELQMEAHHYCNQLNEDFAQCVLFDGNTAEARLMGIEYIISEKLYATLPAEERAYWHPHNYEILSGELRMPGLPQAAEKQALARKINSYGKTWHTWMTGAADRSPDPLPLGPAVLQWSFNRDGEVAPAMIDARDRRMDLDTAEARRQRQDLVPQARPQGGVDTLAGAFPDAKSIPGVIDNGDAAARPVPALVLRPERTERSAQP